MPLFHRVDFATREASGHAMPVNDKRTLYVGGLEESVTEETVRAAFVPFGELTDVSLPMDGKTQKHKGFAFVQFDSKDDAAEAIDNMHNAELYGRVLRVNMASGGDKGGAHRPVWEASADEYFQQGNDEDGDEAAAADN